ncbi:MAG: DUF4962 domain-containing protein [Chloroflexaceae bacterium]|nr:DUF4962 domain-containing protein [Chloroflexaceae bacterium]
MFLFVFFIWSIACAQPAAVEQSPTQVSEPANQAVRPTTEAMQSPIITEIVTEVPTATSDALPTIPNREPAEPTPSEQAPELAAPIPPQQLQHPRLFLDAATIASWQERASTTHQSIWQPVQDYALAEVDAAAPPTEPPVEELNTFRNAGNQLIPLALVCTISERDDVCDRAITTLLAYAQWPRWESDDDRGLGLSHMVLGHALAYDWLYQRLSADQREIVRSALGRHAQELYEASASPTYVSQWNNWWGQSYIQNHYWSTHSAIGLAGLALLNEDDRAIDWLNLAQERMARWQTLLEGVADGSWHESIRYQSYGLAMSLPFLINLRNLQGIDLLPHTYLQNYNRWRLYNYLPNGQFILAFGDFEWDWGSVRGFSVLRFTASEYQDPHAQWLVDQMAQLEERQPNVWGAAWHALEFLFYDARLAPQAPDTLPLARVFPDLEGVIWRTGWGNTDLVFGLKSGPFGGRFAFDTFVNQQDPWNVPCELTGCNFNADHDHADTNGFYLARGSQWLAPEQAGNEQYDTIFHNTLLIDDQGQTLVPPSDQWKDPAAFIGTDGFLETTASTPHFDYVAADATRRYPSALQMQDVTRHVVFVRPGYLLMLDHVQSAQPRRYTWVSHTTTPDSTIEENWVRNTAEDGQVLAIAMVAPDGMSAAIDEEAPAMATSTNEPLADARLVHLLYPTDAAGWANRPQPIILADDEEAIAVQVRSADTREQIDDILISVTAPDTGISQTGAHHTPDVQLEPESHRFVMAALANNSGAVAQDDRIDLYAPFILMRAPRASIAAGDYQYDGRAAVITRDSSGQIIRLFVAGASFLADQQGNRLLVDGISRASFEAIFEGNQVAVSGTTTPDVSAGLAGRIRLYAPLVEQLTVNGVTQPFTREGDTILFSIPAP